MNKCRKSVFKYKNYAHFDSKKKPVSFENKIKNRDWVARHGFYPFIHYKIKFNKYVYKEGYGKYSRQKKSKKRDIYYSSHIDRYIYQYYANELNHYYNQYAKSIGINKASIAYRNELKGKCNIDFSKEVIDFIVKTEEAFIYIADFTSFFDGLDHKYLKEKICTILGCTSLPKEHYSIYKSITNFTYIEKNDILKYKQIKNRDFNQLEIIFDNPKEFREFKSKFLKKHKDTYKGRKGMGIPQGSSISAVYSNIYMIDFDKKINDYVTSNNGIYRRYCDDIIIVLPLKCESESYKHHVEKINEIKEETDNLIINDDKTSKYIYKEGTILDIDDNSESFLDYLGFSFDGKAVKLREKSLFKFYSRMNKKIKISNIYSDKYKRKVFRKRMYKLYSHLGASNKSGYGNFLTYAYKSYNIFGEDNVYKNMIRKQVKKHWKVMNKKLIKIERNK